jgi:hypothetical protein
LQKELKEFKNNMNKKEEDFENELDFIKKQNEDAFKEMEVRL